MAIDMVQTTEVTLIVNTNMQMLEENGCKYQIHEYLYVQV